MLVFVVAWALITLLWGLRSKKSGSLERTSLLLGYSMLVLWLSYNLYYFQPARFTWETSLPLHACDVIAAIAGIVLIKPYRIGRAVLYLSALALTTQAIITPTGDQDPTQYRFWLYWALHAGIVACSLFDFAVLEYRPSLEDFLWVVAIDIAYALIVVPLNVILGWNYGYLGSSKPDVPTAIDLLGPWPQRIALILGLVITLQFLMLVLGKGAHALRGKLTKEGQYDA